MKEDYEKFMAVWARKNKANFRRDDVFSAEGLRLPQSPAHKGQAPSQ